jgi:hypothetical protein
VPETAATEAPVAARAPARGVRVVAVLGYSSRWRSGLHPVCARRLAHAEDVAWGAETVVLSGWGRAPRRRPEAELMRAAWAGPEVEFVCDPDARTTAQNAANVTRVAHALQAEELVVVTSWWHRRRVERHVRAHAGTDAVRVSVVGASGGSPPHLLVRELVCLALLPLALRWWGSPRRERGG